MKRRVALALVVVALALPSFGQHGASHGGSSGHGGFAGHAGFAGRAGFASHSGFSGSPGFARRAAPGGYRGFAPSSLNRGFTRFAPPDRSLFRAPYPGGIQARGRAPYNPGFANRNRNGNGGRDRDRRRGSYWGGWYPNAYSGWGAYPPYPFVIDPGFYDWDDEGDTSSGSGYGSDPGPYPAGYADASPYQNYSGYDALPEPGYASPPYTPPPAWSAPAERPDYTGSSASSASMPDQPLTLIFNNGRSPITVQNYMMNTRSLTDLDQAHYEQIPLDQIDLDATERANRALGADFQALPASRN